MRQFPPQARGPRPAPEPRMPSFEQIARRFPRVSRPGGVVVVQRGSVAALLYGDREGRVVGILQRDVKRPLETMSIVVAPVARLQGVGSALMAHAEALWGRIDIDKLASNPDSRAAVEAWDRGGRRPDVDFGRPQTED